MWHHHTAGVVCVKVARAKTYRPVQSTAQVQFTAQQAGAQQPGGGRGGARGRVSRPAPALYSCPSTRSWGVTNVVVTKQKPHLLATSRWLPHTVDRLACFTNLPPPVVHLHQESFGVVPRHHSHSPARRRRDRRRLRTALRRCIRHAAEAWLAAAAAATSQLPAVWSAAALARPSSG